METATGCRWINGYPEGCQILLPATPDFCRKSEGQNLRDRPYAATEINLLRIEEELSEIHLRLARVTIENLPWDEFVGRYDRDQTFFYLDPPYHKLPYYSHNLELKDYQGMSKILSGIKAKFILSINDHSEMREVFKDFNINDVAIKYSAAKGKWTQAKELLITNY